MNEDNKIFKTNEFSIEISPVGEAIQAKDIQYFSYDENSGLQLIHILMDGKPLDLPNGTEIRLSAVKLNNQNQKLIYTPEIVDPLKGIVSFVIPREFLGYQGQIRCGLYINFSNNQTMHVGYFYINMGVSDIDTNLTEFTEDFWQGWSEFEAGSTAKMQELEQRIDEQTEIFNNADVYNKTEIEEKLEPFAHRADIDTLETKKADKIDLAQTNENIENLDSTKADKTALAQTNASVATNLATKVDKGGNEQVTMAMLAQPVKEAMAGGSVAVVGAGAVNTTNLVDNSATYAKRTKLGNTGWIFYGSGVAVNFDETNGQLTTSGNIYVTDGGKPVALPAGNYMINFIAVNGYVTFDVVNKVFNVVAMASNPPSENNLVVGIFYPNDLQLNTNNPYKLNGEIVQLKIQNNAIGYDKRTETGNEAIIFSKYPINLDLKNKEIIFNGTTIIFSGKNVWFNPLKDISNYSSETPGYFYYAIEDNTIRWTDKMAGIPERSLNLGVSWADGRTATLNVKSELLVNGVGNDFSKSRFFGKKMWFEGDSMTIGRTTAAGVYSKRAFPIVVGERLGVSIINKAVSSAIFATTQENSMCARTLAADFTGINYVCFAGGTNDYAVGVEIGDFESTDTTKFIPAIVASLQAVYASNPNAYIVLLTPHFRMRDASWSENDAFLTPNKIGLTLNDYCDAIVEVARKYMIPVLDWRRQGQVINKYNYKAITTDYLHLTDYGYQENGHRVASWLENIF